MEHWQRRRKERRPTFGRIYLVDSHTPNGVREERQRIHEISLFLEFLLFEDQRDSVTMQGLYQARPDDEQLLATFGIRLLERSSGLLKRLAAARFGIGWLDYLMDARSPLPANIQPLRDVLEACHGAMLENAIEDGGLPIESQRLLTALVQKLEAVPAEDPEWPKLVHSRYEQGIRRIENELAEHVQLHIRQILQNGPLADLAQTLRSQIEAVLHDDRQPATLGSVLRELEFAGNSLGPAPGGAPEADPTPAVKFAQLQALHRRYLAFVKQQLDVDRVRKWWLLLAFLVAIGLNPLLHGWIAAWLGNVAVFDPAAASPALRFAHAAAQWLIGAANEVPPVPGRPWALLLPALLFGGGLAYGLHCGVKREVQRARRFWTESERGRLTDALRSLLHDLAEVQAELVARLQRDAASNIRNEAGRELGQLTERLRERRREIGWLRSQLHDFLDMHGLDAQSPTENWTRISREDGIRHALEKYEDLARILQTNQPNPGRFQSMQSERKPFKQWNERYSHAFLYPLRFIDELSDAYQEPLEQELAGGEHNVRARELCSFLRRHSGDFSTAFRWKPQAGVPQDSVYCLLPSAWLNLPGVRDTLWDQGIAEEHRLQGADAARAYLLRLQIGVKTACLT